MSIYITHDQLDGIIRFLEGDLRTLDLEAAAALNKLNNAVQGCILKELTGARKRNSMLQERLDVRKEDREKRLESDDFQDSGLDSAEVAKALQYQLQQLKTYRLSAYKVNAILYEMYATWLFNKGERLFLEHPVANEYGPRFWHALKAVETAKIIPDAVWKLFAEKRPDVAAFCKNAARKYYDISDKTLIDSFKKTKAFQNASPSYNNGKWNKEITDTDIYQWKKSLTTK